MTVHIELNTATNRIELRCDFYVGVNDHCKLIDGYKFNGEEKIWTYPARMQTCHSLRRVFGDALEIGPTLMIWARKNAKLYSEQRSMANKPDSDLALVKASHPEFWEAMSSRSYQRSGAQFIAATGHAADISEPGLGKTVTALASLIQAGVWNGRHLVVVSNKTAIRSTWRDQINRWTPDAKVYPMPDGWQKREKVLDAFWDDQEGARFLVMLPHMLQVKQGHWCGKCKVWKEEAESGKSYEQEEDGKIVKKPVVIPMEHYGDNHNWKLADMKVDWPELFEEPWDSIIADECHDYLLKVRDPRSKNQPQWAVGMRRLSIRQGGVKLAVTGTPFRGREYKIFGILHWLDPVRHPSYWAFIDTYFEVEAGDPFLVKGGRGATDSAKVVGSLRPEMEKPFYDLLDSLLLRRTKREVRKQIPDQVPIEHWVELEGEHKRQYQEFEEAGVVALESGVLEGMGRLSELTRQKQLAFGQWDVEYETNEDGSINQKLFPLPEKSPKVELLMNMLRERGAFEDKQPDDAPKFIIASQYVQILNGIRDMFARMKVPVLMITGEVTGKRRDDAVKSFQSLGGPKILLLNTKAGGASLTLDAYCEEMFILDETWIHDDQVQLMGRIDNRGERMATRFYHFIRTRDTIEERIAGNNDDQNVMQSRIMDGRRGQEYALRLLRRNA